MGSSAHYFGRQEAAEELRSRLTAAHEEVKRLHGTLERLVAALDELDEANQESVAVFSRPPLGRERADSNRRCQAAGDRVEAEHKAARAALDTTGEGGET